MNKSPINLNQILFALLGSQPCDDPSCEACRTGEDKPVPPEVQKERWRLDAIEMDARDNIEGRVIQALHSALFVEKRSLIEIEHIKDPAHQDTGSAEFHRARVAYAEQLLALFTAKRRARDGARPKQATEGVSPVSHSDTQRA